MFLESGDEAKELVFVTEDRKLISLIDSTSGWTEKTVTTFNYEGNAFPTPKKFIGKYIAALQNDFYNGEMHNVIEVDASPVIGYGPEQVILADTWGHIVAAEFGKPYRIILNLNDKITATPALGDDGTLFVASENNLYALGRKGDQDTCYGVQHCTTGSSTFFEYCGICSGSGCASGGYTCRQRGYECKTFNKPVFFFDEVYPIPCELLESQEPDDPNPDEPNSDGCTETDDGKDYAHQGYATTDGGYHRHEDSCTFDTDTGVYTLYETYCDDDDNIETESYLCPGRCYEGACT
jgi:hypothetical protein